MRLILAELKKVWKSKIFYLLCICLFCINIFLLISSILNDPNRVPAGAYRKISAQINGLSMEQKEELILNNNQYIEAIAKIEYAARDTALNPSKTSYYKKELENELALYGKDYINNNYLKYTNSLFSERVFANTVENNFLQIKNYSGFLEEIQKKVEYAKVFSGFNSKNDFSTENIFLTADAYSQLQKLVPQFVVDKSLSKALLYQYTDLLILLFCVLSAFVIVWKEKSNGMVRILLASKNGRKNTAFSKIICLAFSLFVAIIVAYSCNLMVCILNYGGINFFENIQSFPFLMRSVLNINVLEYIVLFCVIKWLAFLCIGCLIMLFMLVANRLIVGIGGSFFSYIIMLICYELVPPTADYSLIKYLNPVSLLRTNEMLSIYKNINCFGVALNAFYTQFIFGILFVIIMVFSIVIVFENLQFSVKHREYKSIFKNKKIVPRTVWFVECKKLFLLCGGAAAIIVLAVYCGYNYLNTDKTIPVSEIFYRQYMLELTGEYTKEKRQYLINENKEFDIIYSLDNQLNNKKITAEEFSLAMQNETVLNIKFNAYNKVLSKIEKNLNTDNKPLVYDTGFIKLFKTNDKDISQYLICSALIVFVVGLYGCIDENSNMNTVIKTTSVGRTKLFKLRRRAINIFSAIICLIYNLFDILIVNEMYGLKGFFYSANCIDEFSRVPTFISLFALYIISLATKIFVLCSISNLILYIGTKLKSPIFTIISCTILIIVPQLLFKLNLKNAYYCTLIPVYNFGYTIANIMFLYLIYLVVAIGLYLVLKVTLKYEYT